MLFGCMAMEDSEPSPFYTTTYTTIPKTPTTSFPGEEQFVDYGINDFVDTETDPLSTFSVDVDTGSYTWGRNRILYNSLPEPEQVRVEEYINYFRMDYPKPTDTPFAAIMNVVPSPFRDQYYILRVGIQGKDVPVTDRLPWNLTFLVDVSGSMASRIELVKESLKVLVEAMEQGDQISLCTYAGAVRTVLSPTGVAQKNNIINAIDKLYTGGGTAMADGITNAYNVNMSGYMTGAVNRVLVCSDGDANIGSTSFEDILEQIQNEVSQGITLSTIGFGIGNYNDVMMEQLADNGNGNYFYIDSISEAERIFVEELTGTLQVIAKDVKIQMEFNPDTVLKYRLIGYENREIDDNDFDDDTVDAGEIGANHRVTALYELELTEQSSGKLATCFIRYKEPQETTSQELSFDMLDTEITATFEEASQKFRFIVGVSEFAEILRESPYTQSTFTDVLNLLATSLADPADDREQELYDLVQLASDITN